MGVTVTVLATARWKSLAAGVLSASSCRCWEPDAGLSSYEGLEFCGVIVGVVLQVLFVGPFPGTAAA